MTAKINNSRWLSKPLNGPIYAHVDNNRDPMKHLGCCHHQNKLQEKKKTVQKEKTQEITYPVYLQSTVNLVIPAEPF